MPPTRQRIVPIEQLNAEWRTLGRSPGAVRVLHALAARDPDLARLVHGAGPDRPGPCATPCDLIEFMGRASGRQAREQAAALVRVLLREAELDPLVARFLLQALIPGMLTSRINKSGLSSLVLLIASCPSMASPQTAQSSWLSTRPRRPRRVTS